mmetsp:Transcript_29416/g.61279  ORF Transcript_29416/g.61279 Transcript_29416/m.61279 type:complete len:432 (-) Transcript_29416:80-1375(-)
MSNASDSANGSDCTTIEKRTSPVHDEHGDSGTAPPPRVSLLSEAAQALLLETTTTHNGGGGLSSSELDQALLLVVAPWQQQKRNTGEDEGCAKTTTRCDRPEEEPSSSLFFEAAETKASVSTKKKQNENEKETPESTPPSAVEERMPADKDLVPAEEDAEERELEIPRKKLRDRYDQSTTIITNTGRTTTTVDDSSYNEVVAEIQDTAILTIAGTTAVDDNNTEAAVEIQDAATITKTATATVDDNNNSKAEVEIQVRTTTSNETTSMEPQLQTTNDDSAIPKSVGRFYPSTGPPMVVVVGGPPEFEHENRNNHHHQHYHENQNRALRHRLSKLGAATESIRKLDSALRGKALVREYELRTEIEALHEDLGFLRAKQDRLGATLLDLHLKRLRLEEGDVGRPPSQPRGSSSSSSSERRTRCLSVAGAQAGE